MTIQKAIERAASIKEDSFSIAEKVEWLRTLDGKIFRETILTHEHPRCIKAPDYSPDDTTQELLVPFPHDELYIPYLLAKRDEAYGETDQYNNDAMTFNEQLADFKKYYNRTHMPISV